MNAEIISIGTELLLGHILNTNTAFLSQKLAEAGIDVYNTSVVGDNPRRLTDALRQALGRTDVVITTGGLGPTVDDITIETISKFIGRNSVKWIRNKVGSAPGLIMDHNGKVIICLPGPPRELEPMFEKDILPYLTKKHISGRAHLSVPYRNPSILKSRTIKIADLAESVVNKTVKGLLELKPPTTVGIYAKLGQVELRIMSKAGSERGANAAIRKVERQIRAKLAGHIFGCDDETLEGAVGALLAKRKKTIAVAESCTGGLLSHRLTDVPGSSRYFIAGIVAYSNAIKENILGVSGKLLQKRGAVSRQVAAEMAQNARFLTCADIGIGITGIAGPGGGIKSKPVGLVYVALASARRRIVQELRFRGSREEIKFQATQAALDLIRENTQ